MRRSILLVLCFPILVLSQVDTGTITGTLRDPSGSVIPGGSVAVSEMKTGFRLNLQSDANGTYVTPPLKVGVYSVSVEAKGFRPEKRENLVLQVQDRLRVDFQLQVGAVTEEVVVTEEAPAVQSETSSLGQVITSRQITDLPLNGRDYIQLATLTTGVVRTSEGTNGNVGGSSTGGLNSFVANGARGTLNNFLLDGIDNNSNDNGGVVLRTNVDAIQEFKVQTNGYSAEFGRSGGGVINAVIKSGTNELHGSLFEFFRNSALDARGFFEDPSQKKASFKQNQFGGTIGGPIRRDKVFFFGDYQGTRIRNPLTFVSSVPTLSQKTGDFSGPGNNIIYDPSSYDAATNSRVPFGGNRVPQDQIVALSQNYMNLYPGPNQADKLRNNFIISPNERDRVDQMDARADYNIKESDQLFGRFSLSDRTDFRPAPLPGLANGGGSSTGFAFEVTRGAAVGYTHTFTPTSVNDLRLGFSYVNVHRGIPEGGTQFPPPELQVPGVVNNPKTNGLTIFAPSGYRRVGDPGFAPTLLASQERQISDSLSLIRGRHSLKAGGQVRWSQFNIFQVSRPRGNFSFNGRFTQNPESRSGTGSPLADMLLGLPSSSTISSLLDLGNRQQVYSMFVEDNWKVTPKLTLNLGLRYEYATPIVEVNDKQSNFDFATGQIVVANRNGQSRGLVDVDKFNLGPRIGFAYSPFQDGKTVIRGAYGIFYSLQEIKTAGGLQLAYNVPFFYEPSFISNGITPVLTVPQGFPPLDPTQAVTPPVTSLDRRLHSPSYQQWNFGIQRVLPTQTTLEVAYVGSKGTHLQGLTDHNQIALPGPGDIQERRPYPEYGTFTSMENRGSSSYHSLQVKADKRLTNGLMILSAFTYAKAINDLPEICCSQPWPQNSYNVRAEKGRADFDQRFRWVSSFDYELPLGKGRRFVNHGGAADWILGGWHIGGIVSFTSGFPFSPLLGFDPSNTGSVGLLRANRTEDGNLPPGERKPDNWFNIDAFPLPDDFTFGNSGRNVLDGPGSKVSDLSFRKRFLEKERQFLEFRAEFFNFANHPYFAQPDNFIDDGPGAAGVITGISAPMRQTQFGLKYVF